MKPIIAALLGGVCLVACAQAEIEKAEQRARHPDAELQERTLDQFRDLEALGDYAQRLSLTYSDAAKHLQRNQDLASLAVIGAAGTAASWALGSVSQEAVGRVAVGGVGAQLAGERYA